jgi:hypothetical protein
VIKKIEDVENAAVDVEKGGKLHPNLDLYQRFWM